MTAHTLSHGNLYKCAQKAEIGEAEVTPSGLLLLAMDFPWSTQPRCNNIATYMATQQTLNPGRRTEE